MKFQNSSMHGFWRTDARTHGRTDARTTRNQYAPSTSSKLGALRTEHMNWQQFTKGMRGKPNEHLFPRQVVIQLAKLN